MTTGAGGMVIIGDAAAAAAADDETHTHTHTHTVKSIWSKIITGFSSHTFMNDGKELTTEFWDTKLKSNLVTTPLYDFTVVNK